MNSDDIEKQLLSTEETINKLSHEQLKSLYLTAISELSVLRQKYDYISNQHRITLISHVVTALLSHPNIYYSDDGLASKAINYANMILTKLKEQSNVSCVALPPSIIRYNGGQQCDMLVGPCSCGAWHRLEDLPKLIEELLAINETTKQKTN